MFFKYMSKDYLQDPGVEKRMTLKRVLKEFNVKLWIEFMWLRIGTNGGLLRIRE
jgi:hypothetical protein